MSENAVHKMTDQEMDEKLKKDFYDPDQKERRRKGAWKFLAITLALTVLFSVLNWGVVSDWGKVRVTDTVLVGDDGLHYTALVYVPKSATNENPAPGFVVAHGNSGNARNHEAWCMEMARRGIVALSVDTMGGGNSEFNSVYRTGPMDVYANWFNALPNVDRDNIVVSGHSAGNSSALAAAIKYDWKAFINCDNAMWMEKAVPETTYMGNTLVISGTGDRNDSLDKVRNGVGNLLKFRGFNVDKAEENVVYGSLEENNYLELRFVDRMIHEGPLVNKTAIAYILDFTQQVTGIANPIDGTSQVWQWRDVFGLLGMFSMFAFMLAIVNLLLQTKFFEEVASPMPRNIGLRKTGFKISLIAAIIIPLIVCYTGAFGLTKALGDNNFALFPLYASNKAFSAVIGFNLLGFCMLMLYHFTDGKKHKATLRDYGLAVEGESKLNFRIIGKAFIMAVIALFIGFSLLTMFNDMFGTDLYCRWWGFKVIPWHNFKYYIGYIVVWIFCFIIAAVGLNVERRLPTTGDVRKDAVIQTVFNCICSSVMVLTLVLLQNYLQQGMNGVKAFGTWGLDLTRLWGMPFGMVIAGIGQTYCFRKTGNVWTGVFLMGILCALCCVLYGQFRL